MKNILFFFFFALPLISWSQATTSGHLNFQVPIAVGDFGQTSSPTAGAGTRLNFYLRPTPTSPLQVGIDLGVFNRGHASETQRLEVAGFEDKYKVTAKNGVGNFGLLLKLEPLSGKRISPYIEAGAGANLFYSNVYFNRKNKSSDYQFVGKTDVTKGKWSAYYGGSAGVKIAFNDKRAGGIELKCAYFRGGETSYNAKPRFDDDGTVVFERLRSTTDMLIPQIGFWVDFMAMDKAENTQKQ